MKRGRLYARIISDSDPMHTIEFDIDSFDLNIASKYLPIKTEFSAICPLGMKRVVTIKINNRRIYGVKNIFVKYNISFMKRIKTFLAMRGNSILSKFYGWKFLLTKTQIIQIDSEAKNNKRKVKK